MLRLQNFTREKIKSCNASSDCSKRSKYTEGILKCANAIMQINIQDTSEQIS